VTFDFFTTSDQRGISNLMNFEKSSAEALTSADLWHEHVDIDGVSVCRMFNRTIACQPFQMPIAA
jgi:hypothetical protein